MTMTNGTLPHPYRPPCLTSPENTKARLTNRYSVQISSPDEPPAQVTRSTLRLPFPTIPPNLSRSFISSWQLPRFVFLIPSFSFFILYSFSSCFFFLFFFFSLFPLFFFFFFLFLFSSFILIPLFPLFFFFLLPFPSFSPHTQTRLYANFPHHISFKLPAP